MKISLLMSSNYIINIDKMKILLPKVMILIIHLLKDKFILYIASLNKEVVKEKIKKYFFTT